VADAIAWTGWDLCDTASNHSLDYGQQGVDDTLAAFDAVGIATTGSARSAEEAGRILMTTVKGVRVAYLAYTYGTNGIPLPNPWSVNVISLPAIEADAARAREEGADLVVVNFHWGTQYQHEPDAGQDQLADALLSKGTVDLILGQHVHVVQPIERRFGRYVAFGEGNLLANQEHDELVRHDGLAVVAHVRAENGIVAVTSVRYVPTWNFAPDFVVMPIPWRLAELEADGEGGSAEAEVLRASFDRTVSYAGSGPGIGPLGPPWPVVTGSP
jgi:poly-gamma-glutamate synthesis protein (capsule biosynthesis protein)